MSQAFVYAFDVFKTQYNAVIFHSDLDPGLSCLWHSHHAVMSSRVVSVSYVTNYYHQYSCNICQHTNTNNVPMKTP